MALNSLYCDEVPLSNYSSLIRLLGLLLCLSLCCGCWHYHSSGCQN